jgi:hypothetical protein
LSNVSLVYDGLVSLIEDALPDYTRLPDSYGVGGNDDISMISGFSVGFGPGLNTKRFICGKVSILRTFNIRFTKLRAFTDENAIGRATEEKALMDDSFSIYDLLEDTTSLGGVQVSSLYYDADGGIEFSEDNQHSIINAAISAEYFE